MISCRKAIRKKQNLIFLVISNCSKLNFNLDFETSGFRGCEASGCLVVSYFRDLDVSFLICKLNLLTCLLN